MNEIQFTSQLNFQEFLKGSFYVTYRRPAIIMLTVLAATEGDKGANQYGPDPKNPEADIADHLVG